MNKLAMFSRYLKNTIPVATSCYSSSASRNMRDVLEEIIPQEQKRVAAFRKEHGTFPMGSVTIDQMYGGMRSISAMTYETSLLDAEEGIRFRGHNIPECQEKLPKAKPSGLEPLPEGLLFLLMTGLLPSEEQVQWISHELANRADLPNHVVNLLKAFPKDLHPMAQLTSAMAALNSESKFAKAYSKGVKKALYWEYVYEDAMDLIAKVPTVAAIIYRNLYREGTSVACVDAKKDWSYNFCKMLGYEDENFTELMRLYMTIHSDHEGGNVSAHTCKLVGSTLSDPYLSFSAAMAGLAGPLHGLANQEVLIWLNKLTDSIGTKPTKEEIKEYVLKTLKAGQVVPGFGHAVLRKTDPRYMCQREFALKHLPDDPLFKIVSDVFEVVPKILTDLGKVANPWPNVDCHSGVLLQYYGMKEMNYYTVLFGMSRSLGVMSALLWDRALGLPLERPKSYTTDYLMQLVKNGKK